MDQIFVCPKCRAMVHTKYREFMCRKCGHVPEITDYKQAFDDLWVKFYGHERDFHEERCFLTKRIESKRRENTVLKIIISLISVAFGILLFFK